MGEKFVSLRVTITDKGAIDIGIKYNAMATPTTLILEGKGDEIDRIVGFDKEEKDAYFQKIKDFAEGKSILAQVLAEVEKNPEDYDANWKMAQKYSDRGEREMAMPYYQKVIDLDSEDFKGNNMESSYQIAYYESRYKQNTEPMIAFIASDPDEKYLQDSYMSLVIVYMREKEPEKLIATFDEALQKMPANAWLMSRYAGNVFSMKIESYYEKAPVFAVVGGMGKGAWAPVNEFCEYNKIPCLYPSIDVPYRADEDFYTVYSSPGLLLEADLVAAHLASEPLPTLTQVVCDPDLEPVVAELQQALADTDIQTDTVAFDCDDTPPALTGSATYVLWLDRATLQNMPMETLPGRVYISSTLLDGDVEGIITGAEVFTAHPYRLPGEADPAMRRFKLWADSRGVELVAPRQQAEAYFACLVINDAVKHMGRFRIREYALDMMDHAEGLSAYMPLYPRPSLGPGQRFINKGGYILPVIDGELAPSQATWINP